MAVRSNFHTHTCYCDGSDTPEELVQQALSLGFAALGFSGHSYVAFDTSCGMPPEREEAYYREILRLKEAYAGQIELYPGLEQDYYSDTVRHDYDYIIGSVHYVKAGEEYLCVDWSAERTREIVRDCFAGDPYAYAEAYYKLVGQLGERTGCDIVGHFDLLRKFDEKDKLFDENEPRYRRAALDAIERLCSKERVFEINTGAMSRGYRTAPYPSLWILKELKRRGAPIMISSDCHSRQALDYGFAAAVKLAAEAGYTQRAIFRNGQLCMTDL